MATAPAERVTHPAKKVEDVNFFQVVFLVRHNVGTRKEVMEMDRFERLCWYYAIQEQEGMRIDWSTGEIFRPPPQTLR